MQRTFQATLSKDTELFDLARLEEFVFLFNKVERNLYKDLHIKKLPANLLKIDYQKKFKINARHYNSIKSSIDGKVLSVLELNKEYLDDAKNNLEELIKTKNKQSKKIEELQLYLEKLYSNKELNFSIINIAVKTLNKYKTKIHYTNKRIEKTTNKIAYLEKSIKDKNPHICFGTKKLFKQQYLIGTNNNKTKLSSIEDWKKSFNYHRNKTFSLVGSKDENSGNLNCKIVKNIEQSTYSLDLNLPSGRISLPLNIHTGLDILDSIIEGNKSKNPSLWQAITYRFYKLEKPTKANPLGWKIFISVDLGKKAPVLTTDKVNGTIGIDINTDHLAVSEIDNKGNFLKAFSLPFDLKNKTTSQTKSILGDVIAKLMAFSKDKGKPIILEDLDFSSKKKALKSGFNKKYNQMLSSLAYNKIISLIESRSFDNGIKILKVNPAFTSVIGQYKYQNRLKLTVHESASFVIARRGLLSKKYKRTCLVDIKDKESKKVINQKLVVKSFTEINKEKPISNIKNYKQKLPVRIIELGNNKDLWKFHSDYWKQLASFCSKKPKDKPSKKSSVYEVSEIPMVLLQESRGTVPLTESDIHIPF